MFWFVIFELTFSYFLMQVMKKNRDPRWDKEFEFMCEQPPINDRMHVEVLSKPPKKGLIYSKVFWRINSWLSSSSLFY